MKTSGNSLESNAVNLVLGNEPIQVLALNDFSNDILFYKGDYIEMDEIKVKDFNAWYADQDSTIQKLKSYLIAGYQRIHPVEDWIQMDGLRPNQMAITVMVYDVDSTLYNTLFVLETTYWVEQVLGPKMQLIDRDEFNVAVYQRQSTQEAPVAVYSTDEFNWNRAFIDKKLWLLPNTFLAIQSKGESYIELIQSRSRKNLYFLMFAIVLVLLGVYITVRNVRNTLKIAQLKSDFVSNVSHEIRTPLSLIRMYAETLVLGRLPSEEKKQQYYNIIHRESGRLTYLVNNILDFSRIEANRKTYEMTKHNINDLVSDIYNNYEHYFREHGVQGQIELPSANMTIAVDPQAFEEALSNLIENAIKYSNGEKRIHLRTFSTAKHICCDIIDNGSGISQSVQEHIFDKFYRAEDAMTQKTKGTGLGLSIVKHIMEAHNGYVTVDSKPGKGSTFTLKFPIIRS